MRTHPQFRHRLISILTGAILCAACPGSTDPADNGNSNGTNATVILTINKQTGAESGIEVRYHIADGPVTRAAATPLRPQLLACFDFDPVCTIPVPVGKTINFYAYDGPHGQVIGDRGPDRPLVAPDPLQFEFLFWGAECVGTTAALGDCSLAITQARTYTVGATFATLKQAVFEVLGSISLTYSYTARDRLYLPLQPYVPVQPGTYTGALYDPAAPKVQAILPLGATVTASVAPAVELSNFLRWEGPCVPPSGGTSLSCTLQVGAVPPPVARAVGEYYQCGPPSPVGRSSGGTGPNPPPGCTKVTR